MIFYRAVSPLQEISNPRRTPANPFQEILKPFLTVQGGLKESCNGFAPLKSRFEKSWNDFSPFKNGFKISWRYFSPLERHFKVSWRLFRTIKAESNAKSIIIVYLAGQFKHLIRMPMGTYTKIKVIMLYTLNNAEYLAYMNSVLA